jgi:hypothetical protein
MLVTGRFAPEAASRSPKVPISDCISSKLAKTFVRTTKGGTWTGHFGRSNSTKRCAANASIAKPVQLGRPPVSKGRPSRRPS